MKLASNLMLGLGLAMLLAYAVIGLRTGAGLVHHPVVMLAGGLLLTGGGLAGRLVLPRLMGTGGGPG